MLVASQVDELRPVDEGVPKSDKTKMLSDHEGAKQFVTQQLTKLKEKMDEAKTLLSKKSAAEGMIASVMGSSGTAATTSKSASESRDEQDDGPVRKTL